MSIWTYVKREKYKLAANAFVATVGFFFAFFANTFVDEWKEKKVFLTTLSAIRAEALSNEAIYRESFGPLYKDGLVLREFNVLSTSQAINTTAFIKNVPAEQLLVLGEYVRNLTLANSYRSKAETVRLSEGYFDGEKQSTLKQWESVLVRGWEENLFNCQKSISIVKAME